MKKRYIIPIVVAVVFVVHHMSCEDELMEQEYNCRMVEEAGWPDSFCPEENTDVESKI